MKNKKIKLEYLILIALIIPLSLYLIFKNTNKIRYKLPKLQQIETKDIDVITLNRTGKDNKDNPIIDITLVKNGGEWQIFPQEYKADSDTIKTMLTDVTELVLTDLVSTTEHYKRYDLDDASKIRVTAFKGKEKEEIILEFDIGRTASSYQHTYVMLAHDKNVYHAGGNIRSTFDVEINELRDKVVLDFSKESIQELNIENKNRDSLKLVKAIIPQDMESQDSDTGNITITDQDQGNPKTVWKTSSGEPFENNKIENLLNHLSYLKCTEYAEDTVNLNTQLYSILLIGDKEYKLTIFAKQDDKYPGQSSENKHTFLLDGFKTDKIINELDVFIK